MKTVLYLRCSTNETKQDVENQRQPLLKLVEAMGYEVSGEYVDYASGGNSNRPEFQRMLKDAERREFDVILIWALDRFSREGISNTLSYLERIKRSGVILKSLQDSWLDTSDKGMSELLLAIFSWVAKQERERISERVRAGLERTKSNGTRLGRPAGSKDKGRRRTSGYLLRWQREIVQI